MSRNPKDDIIGELEFQLAIARRKIAAGQNLIAILERHSHLVESKYRSASCRLKELKKDLDAIKQSNTTTMSRESTPNVNGRKAIQIAVEDVASSSRSKEDDDQELDSDPDFDIELEEDLDSDLDEDKSDQADSESDIEEVDEENAVIHEDINTDTTSLLLTEHLASQMANDLPSSSSSVLNGLQDSGSSGNGNKLFTLERDFRNRPKKYICHQCNYSTAEPDKLKKHFRVHTGEKPFLCDHLVDGEPCGRRFSHKHQLVYHSRSHTGERPYVCSFPDCNRSFIQTSGLKLHIRRHNDERPYVCTVSGCPAAFADRSHLSRHENDVHLGLRPYKCPHCKWKFGRKPHLDRHVSRVHPDLIDD